MAKTSTVRVLPNKTAEKAAAQRETERLFNLLRSNAAAIESMAEVRQEVGEATKRYLDDTGHHKVAVGFLARLHRAKPETRADILRTLDTLLPLARAEWAKGDTPDMFDSDRPTDPDAGGPEPDDLAGEMGAGSPPDAP